MRRLVLVVIATVGLVLGATSIWYLGSSSSAQPPDRVLGSFGGRPLPPGPPNLQSTGAVSVERVTLADMIRRSEVIFVGRVEEIGGSEVVSPDRPAGFGIHSSHRTRFSVREQFRGTRADWIDISVLDIPDYAVFEQGKEYVVFAEWREIGTIRSRALVPSGYFQGVYGLSGETATNSDNGSVSLDTLRRTVGRA